MSKRKNIYYTGRSIKNDTFLSKYRLRLRILIEKKMLHEISQLKFYESYKTLHIRCLTALYHKLFSLFMKTVF